MFIYHFLRRKKKEYKTSVDQVEEMSTVDRYINTKIANAKELLESGIEFRNIHHINSAISIYKELKPIVKEGSKEQWDNVAENMVRACSAACLFPGIDAVTYLQMAETFIPNHPCIQNNLGFIYHKAQGNYDLAIQHYERCLTADPKYAVAYLGIIDIYRELRHHSLELEYCKKAVKECPESPEILNSYGLAMLHNNMFKDMGRIMQTFEKSLLLEPSGETRAKIYTNIGHVNGILGDFKAAIQNYVSAISCTEKHHAAYQNILLNLHYFSDSDLADSILLGLLKMFGVPPPRKGQKIVDMITALHKEMTVVMYGKDYPPAKNVDKSDVTRKIVVGYMTSDLIDHAVSYFANSIFENYNSDGFDVYIYSNNVYDAESISKVRCTAYRCINNAAAKDVADQIEKDKIDILVDLSGHTAGNRLDVVALRPAPIILSYLGYPDDTGFPFVKRITDLYTERSNNARERILCMKRLFLCYTPKALGPIGSQGPRDKLYDGFVKSYKNFKPSTGLVTYGCFAKLQKINDHVVDLFIQILQKMPKARLVLKSKYFQDQNVVQKWKVKFREVADRVLFMKGTTAEGHMRAFSLLDVHLDTFPYSGTTITTESLFMNVPVVTLAPRTRCGHVSRVSGSILKSMNFEGEMVATTPEEYVSKAINLPQMLPHLPSVRKRFLSSEISDNKGFIASFEKLLVSEFVEG